MEREGSPVQRRERGEQREEVDEADWCRRREVHVRVYAPEIPLFGVELLDDTTVEEEAADLSHTREIIWGIIVCHMAKL